MRNTFRLIWGAAVAFVLVVAASGCGSNTDAQGCPGGTTPVNTDGTTASTHYLFPVNSGNHAGLPCNTCHGGEPDWTTFNCLCCHAHEQTRTDGQHSADGGVPGYQYVSTKCYQCHTTG